MNIEKEEFLDTAPATALVAGSKVGIGLGVGVVGGGTIHELLSDFITVPNLQVQRKCGSSVVLSSVSQTANFGHLWVKQGSGQLVWFQR